MKNVEKNAELISSRAILSADYLKIASVLQFFCICGRYSGCFAACCFFTQKHSYIIIMFMELSKFVYVNSCVLQQLTNEVYLTKKPLNTQLHSASYFIPPPYAHTFSTPLYFRMVSAHILALHLWIKQHTYSIERGKALRHFNQIYRHLLNAVVLFLF